MTPRQAVQLCAAAGVDSQYNKQVTKTSLHKPPTVGFISLGCPKNLVDSEVMMGLLERAGARLTAHPEEAEILIVNTCSFIDSAKQESVDAILEMARYKSSGRAKKLIVAGCLVERYRDEIRKSIPEVDAVVGAGEIESILEAAGVAPASPSSPFRILRAGPAEIRPGQESQAGTHRHAPETAKTLHEKHPSGAEARANSSSMMYGLKPVPFKSAFLESVEKHTTLKGRGFSHATRTAKTTGVSAPTASRPEGNLRERQGRFRRDAWQGAARQLPTYLYDETTPRFITTPTSSAYIKIAEGCDHPCAFCVIPNLRGKFRSRRLESVVAEARQLVAQGTQEITLIAQDTTCYGEDLGMKDGLAQLLDAVAAVPGVRWLRFLYAYPNRITTRLLETIARHDNICKYLDLPLQHAAPAVLKRMKRGGSGSIFLKTLKKARATIPGVVLRTAFIVGFPGESARDFEILEEFVREAKFDWLGVFGYSDEEGSASFALDGKVPRRTIESRRRRLMKLQQGISRRAKRQWVGRKLVLLAEGESKETPLLWEGRTEFHAPEIDGKVYINDFGTLEALEPGHFYNAEITEAHDYDLVARVVDGPL
jgi:ribosomal protein S12 methylthiotransferase